jgi:glycerol-3-phosphate acyltransferase PlsY
VSAPALSPYLGLAIAYVLGSIPTAYLAGRLLRGIDLREHGSGNLGATNVYRVLGAPAAVVVFLVDALKGALPVLLLPRWTDATHLDYWAYAYGIAAIVGHVRPIFLLWKGGGKGVATASGVFFALAPRAMLAAFVTFVVVLAATGYVSLGSLTGALVLGVALLVTHGARSPLFVVGAIVAAFVFWSHRANIGRLRRGEEHRFGRRAKPAPTTSSGDAL